MSLRILAIDPGPEQSAFATVDRNCVPDRALFGKWRNDQLAVLLGGLSVTDRVVIEMIASYGMPVGREVFETCVWIGRFIAACGPNRDVERIFRRDVKLHLCNSAKAKDANVRQALLDRFGGKAKAIGTKKAPGPLYGIKGDEWAALAVAVTYADTRVRIESQKDWDIP